MYIKNDWFSKTLTKLYGYIVLNTVVNIWSGSKKKT